MAKDEKEKKLPRSQQEGDEEEASEPGYEEAKKKMKHGKMCKCKSCGKRRDMMMKGAATE